ncbi:MAG: DUF2314 domain-containing protein [Bacteroidota bacterium]|nr:DUF2314 domain-containing protein [Bacteroidota bacterium]
MKRFLVFLFIVGYTAAHGQTKVSGNTIYQSVSLVKDDSTFLALKDTAQAHLHIFIDSLNKHGKDVEHYRFTIKSDFIEGDEHEHMWSLIFSYSNNNFNGVFIDSAFTIKNIKTGDKVSVNCKSIEDWSIDNLVTGAHTGYYSEMYIKSKERN